MDIIRCIQQFSNPFLDVFFQLVTMIGEDVFFIFVTAIIYWCIDKELGYKLGFVTLTSACINFGVKDFLKIPRPIGEPGIRSLRVHTAEGYSFPSGHTQNTATLWTFFMRHFRRGWLYAAGIPVILLVGVSRLYLGVHTPADVAGGMLIGSAWVFVWGFFYDKAQGHNSRVAVIAATAAVTAGLLVFREANYYKVAGALAGLLAGYLIEPRFIAFKVEASLPKQVLKVSLGMSVLYLLRLVLKLILPGLLISGYLRYLILILWVTTAAPYIFKRFIYTMK
ncbi:MAG TPA: phosphatase PAP2 family protein [Clostridia bacterium]|nr:phosphatase PAP2 family protein [Clostridia bacterium]